MISYLLAKPHESLLPASVWVSIFSLAFTVISFWWLFARRGKLLTYEPHSFTSAAGPNPKLLLRFPLVLETTGPRPIVIQNFRLSFPEESKAIPPLPWAARRSTLKVITPLDHEFPAVFAVQGREATQHFIEFAGNFSDFRDDLRDYRVRIEVKVGHHKNWDSILEFILHAGHITTFGPFIVYSNLCDGSVEDHENMRH